MEEQNTNHLENTPETVEPLEAAEVQEPVSSEEAPEGKGQTELDALSQQVGILNDQLLRALAEFDNYRKRSQREINQITQNAGEKIITELLPVIDDMERGIKAAREWQTEDKHVGQFVQGLEIISGKLMKVLQSKGLQAMESVGKPLDPHLHDALMQIVRTDVEPNTVIDEHEKGYFLNDRVIRHAKVIVSKLPDS